MTRINHRESGSGPVVILIHGFPMNQHVWDDICDKLNDTFHVVTLDLPGFGKSSLPSSSPFTLEDVAREVLLFIREKNYIRPVLVGHSLGGYVTLALAEQAPELLAGICLFHSTGFADSDEKRQSRNKVLEFIDKQGVQAFTSNFIGPLYADPQHHSITKVKNIAVQSSREAVEGYTRAMRDRKDRTHVIRDFKNPILLLGGEKDAGIPPDTLARQARLNPNTEVVILPEVAHMGMFEAEGTCVKKISNFVEKCQVTSAGSSV